MRRLVVLAGVVALTAVSSAGAGRPEPNGRIAFVSDRRGADNLYTVQPDGSGLRELTHSFAAASDPHVSRDRRQVVYSRIEGTEQTEIWTATIHGTSPRRIIAASGLISNMAPAWSPDGRRLAFIRLDNEEDEGVASAYVVGSDGRGLRRITPAGREVDSPAWSPDGSWIAVTDEYAPGLNDLPCGIGIVRSDGSEFRRLITGRICPMYPVWSPDGSHIAFTGGDTLYVVRRDGSQLRRIVDMRDGQPITPEWSPDGRHIAFAFFGYRRGSGVYVVRPSGSGLRRLTGTRGDYSPSWTSNRSLLFSRGGDLWGVGLSGRAARLAVYRPAKDPAWSPNATTLLFTAWDAPDDPSIYELPAQGGRWRAVVASSQRDTNPSWSPDGERIAFSRGERFVWTADRNGRRQRRVVEGIDPDWSPGGRRLAYTVVALWVVNVDGSGARRLSPRWETTVARLHAEWAPGSGRIAFTRAAAGEGKPNVYVINANGSGPRRLIRNASEPTWSPDGRAIAFVRDGDIWVRRLADGRESLLVGGPHREHSPTWGVAGP